MKHLVWLLLALACKPVPADAPAPGCAGFCQHLADLGCPSARPTPEGATCEQICENVQGSGIIYWDLDCRGRATSCEAVDQCERETAP